MGSWNDRGPTLRIEEWLCDIPAGDAYKASAWDHFIDLEPIATLYHPDHARTADVRAIDLPHIHTRAGTAAYDDNEQALTQIMNIMVHALKFKCVFVVGDQQSFIRMVSLIRGNPKLYKWLIPLPGEFHFEVHALMAVHRLCWKCLVRWIVQVAEICPKARSYSNELPGLRLGGYDDIDFFRRNFDVRLQVRFGNIDRNFLSTSSLGNKAAAVATEIQNQIVGLGGLLSTGPSSTPYIRERQ